MKPTIAIAVAALASMSACQQHRDVRSQVDNPADNLLMITGSYAPADSAGIKSYVFNQSTGEYARLGSATGVSNPSFVTLDTVNHRIYAVGEDAGLSSTVNMLEYSPDGTEIKLLASAPTQGGAPCHVALTPDGKQVVTANYMGGSVTIHTLDSLGAPYGPPSVIQFAGKGFDGERQSQSHLHQITFSDSSTMLANDLGLDRVAVIKLPYDSAAVIDFVDVKPGSGPRHTTFDSSRRHAYTITELSGEVIVWDVVDGKLQQRQTVVADSVGAKGSGDIHISPDGRYLYASNRLRNDGLAIFSIDPDSGELTWVGYQPTGPHPRNFAITPNGRFLLVACRDSDAIEIYERNESSGKLTPKGNIPAAKPTCIMFAEL